MSAKTGIAWTSATWNPVRGCERVSEGCRRCYAEVLAARHSYPGGWGVGLAKFVKRPDGTKEARWTGVLRTVEKQLEVPLHWRAPRRIFVNSMSDLFHEQVPDSFIDRVVSVAVLAQQHIYQCLTKRAERMLEYWSNPEREAYIARAALDMLGPRHAIGANFLPLKNWQHGVSIEDQAAADERIPLLLHTPAAVRFVSCEPLLGEIDLNLWRQGHYNGERALHWCILGGESGSNYRPMNMEHARSLIAQCKAAGVPIFVKQDSGPRPGMQGRFTDQEWALKEYPA
jgi:protein gp37